MSVRLVVRVAGVGRYETVSLKANDKENKAGFTSFHLLALGIFNERNMNLATWHIDRKKTSRFFQNIVAIRLKRRVSGTEGGRAIGE